MPIATSQPAPETRKSIEPTTRPATDSLAGQSQKPRTDTQKSLAATGRYQYAPTAKPDYFASPATQPASRAPAQAQTKDQFSNSFFGGQESHQAFLEAVIRKQPGQNKLMGQRAAELWCKAREAEYNRYQKGELSEQAYKALLESNLKSLQQNLGLKDVKINTEGMLKRSK